MINISNHDLAELIFPDVDSNIENYLLKYPKRNVSNTAIVTRYAPSPTGFVHIGALFASFCERTFAKQSGGVFYLRIEDTDTKRTVENGINLIIEDLKRFNVTFDEGPLNQSEYIGEYGPYIQTQRKEIYQSFVKYLIEKGEAYPCFCSEEEVNEIRKKQEAEEAPIGYWGKWARCRNLPLQDAYYRIKNGEQYIIRFKSRGNKDNKIVLHDLIKGDISLPENELDIVIMKQDGYPTYHFAHVVDDTLMRSTHIIRGDEWISTYPIHKQLFAVLGLEEPRYAHISPLLKNDNGSIRKLSKRKDSECAMSYYDEIGMPSEAVVIYLATIANSNFEEWYLQHPHEDIYNFRFTFEAMSSSGAMFDLVKMYNISKNYIGELTAQQLYDKACPYLKKKDPQLYRLFIEDPEYTLKVLRIDRENEKPRKDIAVYSDIKNQIWFMYDELFTFKWDFSARRVDVGLIKQYMEEIYNPLEDRQKWFDSIKDFAGKNGYATDKKMYKANPEGYKGVFSELCEMLRFVVSSQTKTMDLYSILQVMDRERILNRIRIFEETMNL
ncbi:MAG: glutamate--tRNA ligase [Lachnospiraceae bacterium]|nr:glutamate--tRNA ligase [Lachnospiraceae bacterium]